jgi:hypothetical protein
MANGAPGPRPDRKKIRPSPDTNGAKMFHNVGTQGGIDKSPMPGQYTRAVQDEHINSRQ